MITAKGHNGTVTFDGRFVEIQRTGFLARASVGKGTKRIPITAINAVQWKPPGPLVNGYIEFTVPGGIETRGRFGSATTTAGQNENSVVVTRNQAGAFLQLRDAIENALVNGHTPATPPPPSGPPPGWYNDPHDPTQTQWWDGTTWTGHRQPH